jgi:hypothetical protein
LKEDAICGAGGKYGGEKNAYRVLVRKSKGKKTYLEDLGENWNILFKLILRKQGGRAWIALIWLSIEKSGGLL